MISPGPGCSRSATAPVGEQGVQGDLDPAPRSMEREMRAPLGLVHVLLDVHADLDVLDVAVFAG